MRLRRSIFLLALCLAPLAHADDFDDGASLTLDGQTLHGGYFGSAMHTGLIEVHKLAPHGAQTAASAGGEHNP